MRGIIREGMVIIALLTALTGLAYPISVTLLTQKLFPFQANGSLGPKGSLLIGQSFSSQNYFWNRPTRAALASCDPALIPLIKSTVSLLKQDNPAPIPIDLVSASASQVDPHISPQAAYYQAPRIAKARNMDILKIHALIEKHIQKRTLGLLGEPRVNVLSLNQELDNLRI